jgi:hypothetical protein
LIQMRVSHADRFWGSRSDAQDRQAEIIVS